MLIDNKTNNSFCRLGNGHEVYGDKLAYLGRWKKPEKVPMRRTSGKRKVERNEITTNHSRPILVQMALTGGVSPLFFLL